MGITWAIWGLGAACATAWAIWPVAYWLVVAAKQAFGGNGR